MARAQASVELMALTAVLLLLLFVFSFFVFQKRVDLQSQVTIASGQQIADAVAAKANTAITVGDGYSEDFVLPLLLENGIPYSITLIGSDVVVAWEYNGAFEASANVARDAALCGNLTVGGWNNVRNVAEDVSFNGASC